MPPFNTLTLVLIALAVGLFLGAILGFWFEDVLRGPILRAYDDDRSPYSPEEGEAILTLANDD